MNIQNLCLARTYHFNDLEQECIDIGYISSTLPRIRVIFLKICHESK